MAEWSKAVDLESTGQLSSWVQASMFIEDLVWPVFLWPHKAVPFAFQYRRSCLAGFTVAAKLFDLRFRQSQYIHKIENQTGYRMVLHLYKL